MSVSDALASTSMQIIIQAGDGRTATYRAIDALASGDLDGVTEHMTAADAALQRSHALHTDHIQREADGEPSEYSVLFSHAQDTLMTAYSEFRLMKRLLPVLHGLEERIAALEAHR